jgi:hypothetical protein
MIRGVTCQSAPARTAITSSPRREVGEQDACAIRGVAKTPPARAWACAANRTRPLPEVIRCIALAIVIRRLGTQADSTVRDEYRQSTNQMLFPGR